MTIASAPVKTLRVSDIYPSRFNPRSPDVAKAAGLPPSPAFAEHKLRDLGASMRSAMGQLEALLVRPHPTVTGGWELANGERRWRAAQLVGLETLACKVRDLTDAEMAEIALAIGAGDNVENLTALEEALGYQQLKDLRGFSALQLAEHLGRNRKHVERRLSLLHLSPKGRTALQDGTLSATTGWRIGLIPVESARLTAEAAILHCDLYGGVMPERAAAEYISENVCRPLTGTVFDQKDATLVPEAGACETCPFRIVSGMEDGETTKRQRGGANRCMSPECFAKKVQAHHARVLALVAVDGKVGLAPEENATVFPEEERGLDYRSPYVPYNERPTPDLLKKEVTSAPTWRELTDGRGVQIYVGVNQDGRAVELVKRNEAIAAADLNERKIFNEAEVKRGTVARAEKPSGDSRATVEKTEKATRTKAEKEQRRKDTKSCSWLRELADELALGRGRAPWETLVYWTLVYDLAAATLSPEEIAFVVRAWDQDAPENERNKAGLDVLAHGMDPRALFALVNLMLLAPRIRVGGADCELANEWHETLLMGSPEELPPYTADAGGRDAVERLLAASLKAGDIVEWGAGHEESFWGWWYPQVEAEKLAREKLEEPLGRGSSCVVRLMGGELILCITPTAGLRIVDDWQADRPRPGCPEAEFELLKNPLPAEPKDVGVGIADRARRTRAKRRTEREASTKPATIPVSPEEAKKLAEVVKAAAAGMPLPEIARAWDMTIEDVCGALGVPVPGPEAEPLPPAFSGRDGGRSVDFPSREDAELYIDEQRGRPGFAEYSFTIEKQGEARYDLVYEKIAVAAAAAAAQADLDAAFNAVLPNTTPDARAMIMRKYILRVTGNAKPEKDLTTAEKQAITKILQMAAVGKRARGAAVTTGEERAAA